MSSDLTDGAASADPGIDQLFRILTAGPTRDELAGERDALAMFTANVSPLASPAPGREAPRADGTPANGTTVPIPVGRPAAEPKQHARRRFQWPARWGIRLAAAGVIAIVGGTAAAAYAAALPAPVQNLAHQVLGVVGVPAAHHQHHAGISRSHSHHGGGPAGRSSTPPGGHSHPRHAAKPSPSAHASASPTASPSSSTATGPAVLSASASSADIMAGTGPVIDGHLTRSGTGIKGVTVTLVERLAGHPFWHVDGTGQTTAAGDVAITGRPLAANAVFRLRIPGGVHSASVQITVTPQVTVVLTAQSALRDMLAVTTQYAHRGNVVWLQVQSAGRTWVNLRSKRLDASGKAWFILSRKRLKNKTVRVVLVATARHGSAASNTATVQPPS
jgi:hypothetical protein